MSDFYPVFTETSGTRFNRGSFRLLSEGESISGSEFIETVRKQAIVDRHQSEEVTAIATADSGFTAMTQDDEYSTDYIILAS